MFLSFGDRDICEPAHAEADGEQPHADELAPLPAHAERGGREYGYPLIGGDLRTVPQKDRHQRQYVKQMKGRFRFGYPALFNDGRASDQNGGAERDQGEPEHEVIPTL